jgi:hypothetical protein
LYWIEHLSKHLGAIFKLQPKFTSSIYCLLGLKIHHEVLHRHFLVHVGLWLPQSKGEVILDDHRVAETSRAHIVSVDLDDAVIAGETVLCVLSNYREVALRNVQHGFRNVANLVFEHTPVKIIRYTS